MNQNSDSQNSSKLLSYNFENWGAFAIVLLFGLLQDPIIKNLQLLIYLPNKFPLFEMQQWKFDIVLSCVASIFLLIKASSFKTKAWWVSFTCMATPYLYLKYFGVYHDSTNYLIAAAQGRQIGGGAAFGHLFLMFYIAGTAQLVSLIVFYISSSSLRFSWHAIKSNTKSYLKSIFGMTND